MKFRLIIDKSKDEEVLVTAHNKSELTSQIEDIILKYSNTDKIPAYSETDIVMLEFSQIECITVINSKTYAVTDEGERYLIKMRLYEIENLVPSYFIRINKSSLANENRLKCFSVSYSTAVDAVFKSGYREYVSRRCFSEIKRRFNSK